MRVAYFVRGNHETKGGGDLVQMRSTAEALRRHGVEVEMITDPTARLDGFDLVHLFNSPWFAETIAFLDSAQTQRKPVVLSTIFWPKAELTFGVREDGPLGAVLRLLGRRRTLAAFDAATRAATRALPRSGVALERRLFAGADLLMPNSEGEERELERVYRLPPQRYRVVRNAIDAALFSAEPSAHRKPYVLSIGRIEHRKNTLKLIETCRAIGTHLVLIGDYDEDDGYSRQCLRLAGDAGFEHRRSVPQSELLPSYYEAAVYAQVSWYETPGLATMEAACGGCSIVTTDRGSTREYFGDLVEYCDPWSAESIESALRRALAAPSDTSLRDRIRGHYTWDHAAEDTIAGYEAML